MSTEHQRLLADAILLERSVAALTRRFPHDAPAMPVISELAEIAAAWRVRAESAPQTPARWFWPELELYLHADDTDDGRPGNLTGEAP